MSNKTPAPIKVESATVTGRLAQMIQQRDQLSIAITHTVRTVADMMGVPDTYQFDPLTGSFIPVEDGAQLSQGESGAQAPAAE